MDKYTTWLDAKVEEAEKRVVNDANQSVNDGATPALTI